MTAVLNTNIGEVENKIPDVSGLVKKTVCDDKISEIEKGTLLILIIINLQVTYLMQR